MTKAIEGAPDDGDDGVLIRGLFTGLATLVFFMEAFVDGGVVKLDDTFGLGVVVALGETTVFFAGDGVAKFLGTVFSFADTEQPRGEDITSPVLFWSVGFMEDFRVLFLAGLLFLVFFESFDFFFFFGDGIKSLPPEPSDSASMS